MRRTLPTCKAGSCRPTIRRRTSPYRTCLSAASGRPVRGNGKIGGTLSVSKSAHWEGDISAKQAVLAGNVTGRIVIEDKLEISASAVINGEIVAKVLAIANGARIEGEVTVTSGKPILKFEEKRTGT